MRSTPQPVKKSRNPIQGAAKVFAFATDLAAELGHRSERLRRAQASSAPRKAPAIWAETWDATFDSAASNAGRGDRH